MSITFWAPEAPTRTETHDPEGYEAWTEEVSSLPEIKLSSSNALVMLEALGVKPDLCGAWSADQLSEVLRMAADVANVPERLERVGAGWSGIAPPGPVVDHIRRTALRFVDLFRQAQAGGYKVCWG
ncbi:hypothetical protein ACXIVK_00210 [Paraburkholderia caledonica]|jgi:hypothetical protein